MILSICVPTYNRATELTRFFESVRASSKIQIVICDDGSTDDTRSVVGKFQGYLDISYIYQENAGRATALFEAISVAKGEYVIIMDSDDYFTTDGLMYITKSLREHPEFSAFAFGVGILESTRVRFNVPPSVVSNFIDLRVKYGVKEDLKEVVRTSILKECIQRPRAGCRRVPTSLIWSNVAEQVDCLAFSEIVAVKEYLPGGMSDKILRLKCDNPEPLVELYELLSETEKYKSLIYRLKCMFLWARYNAHLGKRPVDRLWKWPFVIPGWILSKVDLFRLFLTKRSN